MFSPHFGFSTLFPSLAQGQVVAVELMLLALAAVALAAKSWNAGAAFTAATLLEPHFGRASFIGGPYMHITQIGLAIPAILVLQASAFDRRARVSLTAALLVLAIPWPYPYESKALLGVAVLTTLTLAWYVTEKSLWKSVACGALVAVVLNVLENRPRIVNPVALVPARSGRDFSTQAWAEHVALRMTHDAAFLVTKTLTWLALAAFVAAVAFLASRKARAT